MYKKYFIFLILSTLLLTGCDEQESARLTRQAVNNIKNNHHTTALQEVNQAINKKKDNHLALSVKAYLLARQGSISDAYNNIASAVIGDKNNSEIRLNSAKVFFYAGEYERALQEAMRATELSKNNKEAFAFLYYINHKLGKTKDVVASLESAAQKETDTDSAYIYLTTLGKIYTELKRDTEALRCYEQILKKLPGNSNATAAKAAIKIKRKEYSGLEKELKNCIINNPNNAELHVVLAKLYIIQKNTDLADKEIEKALQLDETNSQARTLNGIRFIDKGDANSAKQNLSRAAQADKTNGEPLYLLSMIEFALKNDQAAMSYLNKAIEADPSFIPAREKKSDLLLRLGKPEESLRELKLAEKYDPSSPSTQMYIARIYIIKKDAQKAHFHIDKAIKSDPDNPVILYYRSAVYAMQNKKKESFSFLKKSIEKGFRDSDKLSEDFYGNKYQNDPEFKKIAKGVSSDETTK